MNCSQCPYWVHIIVIFINSFIQGESIMSVIDQANHNVVSYVSGTTKPFSGQRLVAIIYKTVTDKKSVHYNIKRESKAVSVPVIADDIILGNMNVLVPHIKTLLENTQKSIIRELLDASNNVVS